MLIHVYVFIGPLESSQTPQLTNFLRGRHFPETWKKCAKRWVSSTDGKCTSIRMVPRELRVTADELRWLDGRAKQTAWAPVQDIVGYYRGNGCVARCGNFAFGLEAGQHFVCYRRWVWNQILLACVHCADTLSVCAEIHTYFVQLYNNCTGTHRHFVFSKRQRQNLRFWSQYHSTTAKEAW